MKLRYICLTIIICLVLGPLSSSFGKKPDDPPPDPDPGMNCEVPPFVQQSVTPNVLIILDNSGSTMTEDVPGHENRWKAAKSVVTNLLANTEGFRWGLMRMDGAASNGERSQWSWQDPATGNWFSTTSNFVRHGGKLLRPIGTDKNEIINYINGMEVYDTIPHTYTVNGETLFTAAQYFAGGNGPAGLGTYKGDGDTNYKYYKGSKSYWASQTDDYGKAIDTSSPIQHWCQKNFVIYLTDGESNCDSDWARLLNLVGDYDGDGADDPNVDEWDESGGNHYLDDVAKWMYENDLRTDDDVMPGVQNVITYVVGLRIDSPLLGRAADENHGRGMYFYAADYDDLEDAFEKIKSDIIQHIASGTAVAVQSTSTQGARRLLRAKFVPGTWTGHLEAFKLPYTKGDTPLWDAGTQLKNKAAAGRYIFTAVDDKAGEGVEMKRRVLFTEGNSSTKDADNNKLSDMLGAADDADAKKIIRYIRGSNDDDYRARADGWKLGDIAYSSPIIWKDVVIVGANDGMLHAFDINNGQELWAFIPNNLLPKLKHLCQEDYCHEYFVDLSPEIADIGNKTVLVGGERGGGKAFFALEIPTDPRDGANVKPMWEFTHENLGESWSIPSIEKFRIDGGPKWVALFGSGFENSDGNGYIFAVDVETGQMVGMYDIKVKGDCLPSLRAIDFNQNTITDRVYVGSLEDGEVITVHINENATTPNPDLWQKNDRIFKTDKDQPISVPTSLSLVEKEDQLYVGVYVGTGKYHTLADKDDTTVQSFYCLIDNGKARGRGGLANQTDPGICEPLHQNFGWFIDFNQNSGERVVSSALIVGGYLFFTTFQPDDDPCKAGGIARLYCVNYDNGCVPSSPVIDIDGDGEFDKINGTVPRSIEIGYGIPSDIIFDPKESSIIIQTSDTTIHVFKINISSERLTVHSWREAID